MSHLTFLSTSSLFQMFPMKQWGWGHCVSCMRLGKETGLTQAHVWQVILPAHQHKAPKFCRPLPPHPPTHSLS